MAKIVGAGETIVDLIFKNGELKWRTSGVTPAATLEEELKKYY